MLVKSTLRREDFEVCMFRTFVLAGLGGCSAIYHYHIIQIKRSISVTEAPLPFGWIKTNHVDGVWLTVASFL